MALVREPRLDRNGPGGVALREEVLGQIDASLRLVGVRGEAEAAPEDANELAGGLPHQRR